MIGLQVGSLVEHPQVPGIGRIGAVDGARVRIDCFESVAAPVVDSRWVAYAECRPVKLLVETRVYWQDSDTGNWQPAASLEGMRRSTSSDCLTLNWISKFQRTNSAFAGTARSVTLSMSSSRAPTRLLTTAMLGYRCCRVS